MELDGVVTIKSVVSDIMFRYGIKQEDYVFLLSTVIDAYRKLNLSVLRQQLYHDDYVNDINIIEFPNDLIMFESIGRIDAGEYKSTTLTDNASPTGILNGRESLDIGESVANNADPITSFVPNRSFSYDTKPVVKFKHKVDYDNRRVIIYGDATGVKFRMYYIGSGTKLGEQTFVPVVSVATIIQYCMWKYYEKNRSYQEAVYHKSQYNEEFSLLSDVFAPSLDEYMDVYYESLGQTLKR